MYYLLLLPPLLKVLLPTKYEVLAILIMYDFCLSVFNNQSPKLSRFQKPEVEAAKDDILESAKKSRQIECQQPTEADQMIKCID